MEYEKDPTVSNRFNRPTVGLYQNLFKQTLKIYLESRENHYKHNYFIAIVSYLSYNFYNIIYNVVNLCLLMALRSYLTLFSQILLGGASTTFKTRESVVQSPVCDEAAGDLAASKRKEDDA